MEYIYTTVEANNEPVPGFDPKKALYDIVRKKRDRLLQSSDWTQLPDVPLSTKEAWAVYRQELRDVTTQTDPNNIVWPVAPT